MPPSKEELIAIVRKYYDSDNSFLFKTELSVEASRRYERWEQWTADMGPWYALRDELSSALPNHVIGETYPSMDGGPRCIVYLPKEAWAHTSNWDVVGCVSLLAPVYFVYGVEWDFIDGHRKNLRARFEQPPPSMAWPAQAVARAIEKVLGFSAFPRELVETPVPLHAGLREPSETTLFHALFTSAPGSIP